MLNEFWDYHGSYSSVEYCGPSKQEVLVSFA